MLWNISRRLIQAFDNKEKKTLGGDGVRRSAVFSVIRCDFSL